MEFRLAGFAVRETEFWAKIWAEIGVFEDFC